MSIEAGSESLVEFTILVHSVMQTGVIVSAFALASHKLTNLLSRFTRVEREDPTVYFRQFESFFNALFEPIGLSVADKVRSPWLSQISFQFSISMAVLAIAVVIYLITGGVAIGSALATHMAFGTVIDPIPVFRQVIALVVICGMAVMFHASERAGELEVAEQ